MCNPTYKLPKLQSRVTANAQDKSFTTAEDEIAADGLQQRITDNIKNLSDLQTRCHLHQTDSDVLRQAASLRQRSANASTLFLPMD